jgi:hypothetical protein
MTLGKSGLAGSTVVAERFYRRRGAPPSSLDNGFLPDPRGFLGKALCPDVCSRAEIYGGQCTVLLGEPGIGKSTAMQQRQSELPTGALFFDLRMVAADEVLQAVRGSRQVEQAVHICIDSVDEADVPSFPARFIGELQRLPRGKVRLELACRASEWSKTLEAGLPDVFDLSEISYFQIEPLRRLDAAGIVESIGVDANAFLEAVSERDLGALAGVPLTLELLLQVFQQDGTFPQRATEIYDRALLHLCGETSSTRLDRQRSSTPARNLEIAGHLAAASVLGNRARLTRRSALLERDGELSIDRLLRNIEGADEAALTAALATGLFIHNGADVASFYHHSFAEFLTARWLGASGFSTQQLRQILFHHEANDHLLPQMAGVATWLACSHSDVAMLLARLAPEHFIRADAPVATEAHRAAAVDALMLRAEKRSLTHRWWDDAASHRLKHDGLAEQLRAYIRDPNRDEFVRRKAIDIARANSLAELGDLLADVALDDTIPIDIRAEAATAAFACTPDRGALVERLRPLAEPGQPADRNEDLRTSVLEHLWPAHIDARELFRLLTRPRRSNYSGQYVGFIRRVGDDFSITDLIPALEWVERNVRPHGGNNCISFEDLAAAICRKGWAQLDNPACREALARVVSRTLKEYRPVLEGPTDGNEAKLLLADTDRRRALLGELARLSDNPAKDAYHVAHPYGQPPFAVESDIPWILAQRRTALDATKLFWETLACRLLSWPLSLPTLDLILTEVGDDEVSPMLPFPRVMHLGSPAAQQAIESQKQELAWEVERERRERQQRERRAIDIEPILERAEGGDLTAWWQVVAQLERDRDRHNGKQLLAIFLGDRRDTYVALAQQYLEGAATEPALWLRERSTTWWPAVAGYVSLRLVSAFTMEWWAPRAPALLRKWGASIVGFDVHVWSEEPDLDAHRALVAQLFESHSDEACRLIGLRLRREAVDLPDLAFLRSLPSHAPIGDVVARCLVTNVKQLEGFQAFFDALVRFDPPRAFAFARGLLRFGNSLVTVREPSVFAFGRRRRTPTPRHHRLGCSRRHSVQQLAVARALVERQDAWPLVHGACQRYPKLARTLFNTFADDPRSSWGSHVPEQDLAEVYRWIRPVALPSEDTDSLVPVRSLRRGVLTQLAGRGTSAAVEELAALETRDPTDHAVRIKAAEGRERYRELSWQPIDPTTLFDLRSSSKRRVVQSSEQLLEVVLEAIDGYASVLQGKPPAVVDLWNSTQEQKLADVEYTPKDESALSNHLKRHLAVALRAVVVNREVEIKPTTVESRTGERVDLLIHAVCPDTAQVWSVVIEVKCSWNDELETGLDDQLATRYLASAGLKCGVYLVGWYACSQWAPADGRRDATRCRDRQLIEQRLIEHAAAASSAGRSVRVRVLDLRMGNG